MSTSIRNSQVEELVRQLAREFGITMDQAEEIYSLRFKFVRECMSSHTLDEVAESGKVKSIRWMGLGEFYPNKKRIKRLVNQRLKNNGT